MTENEVVKEFRQIKQEYAFNPDIMCQDDPRVSRLKEIIDTKLSQVDKTIILLYADCLSYRKLGKKMNLSHMTIRREVMRIKKIILEEYNHEQLERMSALTASIEKYFHKLSPRQREIINLYYIEERKYDDICRIMGINYQSVRNLMHRSISRLREFATQVAV